MFFYGNPYDVWPIIPGARNISRINPKTCKVYGNAQYRIAFRNQFSVSLLVEMLKSLPIADPDKTVTVLDKYRFSMTLDFRMRSGYRGSPASGSLKTARTTRITRFDRLPKAFVKPASIFRPQYLFDDVSTKSTQGIQWVARVGEFAEQDFEYEHMLVRVCGVSHYDCVPAQVRSEIWIKGGDVPEWTCLYAGFLNYVNSRKVSSVAKWPETFYKYNFIDMQFPEPTESLRIEFCDLGSYLIFARLAVPHTHWATAVEKNFVMQNCLTTIALGDPQFARDAQEWAHFGDYWHQERKKLNEVPSQTEMGTTDKRFIAKQMKLRVKLGLMEQ